MENFASFSLLQSRNFGQPLFSLKSIYMGTHVLIWLGLIFSCVWSCLGRTLKCANMKRDVQRWIENVYMAEKPVIRERWFFHYHNLISQTASPNINPSIKIRPYWYCICFFIRFFFSAPIFSEHLERHFPQSWIT